MKKLIIVWACCAFFAAACNNHGSSVKSQTLPKKDAAYFGGNDYDYAQENRGEVQYSGEAADWPTFNGYPCTDDCSGHQAGYDWAERKGIQDADDCGGNSKSFIEGCRSYVEQNY